MPYRHILAAVDLSAESDQILTVASDLAKQTQARLSLVHVQEYTPIVYGGGEFTVPIELNLEDMLRQRAEKAFETIAHKYHIAQTDIHLKFGSTSESILELAQYLNADLIVLGSHDHTGFTQLIGATANAVLHHANCDVYAVRIN